MKSIVSPNEKINAESWFPGRWIGGLSLVLGPILLLAGELLRVKYHFYYPDQLAAFKEQPTLMAASYGLFAAGIIVMWPGILALVRLIGAKKPGWALWGGILAIMGLFARMYHAGVDNLAYWLVQFQGLELATTFISESYAYNLPGILCYRYNPVFRHDWMVRSCDRRFPFSHTQSTLLNRVGINGDTQFRSSQRHQLGHFSCRDWSLRCVDASRH